MRTAIRRNIILGMIEKKEYRITALETISADPEMVISRSMDEEIRKRMSAVVETEAPIREALLFKRVINSISMKKVGSRIEPVFKAIAESLPFEKSEEDGELVFHCGDESFFRPSTDADRYSYQIPIEEAVNCILYILEKENRILTKSALKKLFQKELGYDKTGSKIEKLFNSACRSPRIRRTGNGRFQP